MCPPRRAAALASPAAAEANARTASVIRAACRNLGIIGCPRRTTAARAVEWMGRTLSTMGEREALANHLRSRFDYVTKSDGADDDRGIEERRTPAGRRAPRWTVRGRAPAAAPRRHRQAHEGRQPARRRHQRLPRRLGAQRPLPCPWHVDRGGLWLPQPRRRLHVDRPLDFNELLVRNPASTFAVRISGESMRDQGHATPATSL